MNKTLAVMYLPYGIIVPITMVVDKNLVLAGSLELRVPLWCTSFTSFYSTLFYTQTLRRDSSLHLLL